jgi:hypothetical protein
MTILTEEKERGAKQNETKLRRSGCRVIGNPTSADFSGKALCRIACWGIAGWRVVGFRMRVAAPR